jgi:hypothetical protein
MAGQLFMASALVFGISAIGWAGDFPLGHKDFVPTPERGS